MFVCVKESEMQGDGWMYVSEQRAHMMCMLGKLNKRKNKTKQKNRCMNPEGRNKQGSLGE